MPELSIYDANDSRENLNKVNTRKTPLLKKFGRNLLVREGRKVAKPGVQIDINQEGQNPWNSKTKKLTSENIH